MAKKEDLKEFKASGENSAVMDPVATGSTRRKQDSGGNPDPASMTAVAGAGKKEDMIEKKPTQLAKKRFADKNTPGEKSSRLKEMVAALVKLDDEDLNKFYEQVVNGEDDDDEASVADLVRDDFDAIFKEEDFSEDFKKKAFTIFEGAILTKLVEERQALEEEYVEALEEELEIRMEELQEQVDDYLNHIVENWIEENEVFIERNLRYEMAESFMQGIRDLLAEHYVDVPEDQDDLIEELVSKIEDLEEKYNLAVDNIIELSDELEETTVTSVVDEVTEGLTDSQREKFTVLAEGLSYEDLDELREKLTTLKENTFESNSKRTGSEQQLNEEFDGTGEEKIIDDKMAGYLEAAKKLNRK